MRKTILSIALLVGAQSVSGQITDEQLASLYSKPAFSKSLDRENWIAESEYAFAVRDANPQAPVHLLVISKALYPTLIQAPDIVMTDMLALARLVAQREGIARDGFRLVINTHPLGGQSVYHVHIHVLGGRQMKWPPG